MVISFLCMIDDTASALKIAGNKNGGKLVIGFDDSQVPEAMKAVLMREQELRITLEPTNE